MLASQASQDWWEESFLPNQLWWCPEYYCHEAVELPDGKIRVSPAYPYRLNWGDSYAKSWEMTKGDFLSQYCLADPEQAI